MRIEMVGGLGVGKSTMCRIFNGKGFNVVYEDLSSNPFLSDSYRDPAKYAFPSQMNFVMDKYKTMLSETEDEVYVYDQSFAANRAYNSLLSDRDLYWGHAVVNEALHFAEATFGRPDIIINFQCDPAVQVERIKRRGRSFETVDEKFVVSLRKALDFEINHTYGKDLKNGHIKYEEIDVSNCNVDDYVSFVDKIITGYDLKAKVL